MTDKIRLRLVNYISNSDVWLSLSEVGPRSSLTRLAPFDTRTLLALYGSFSSSGRDSPYLQEHSSPNFSGLLHLRLALKLQLSTPPKT